MLKLKRDVEMILNDTFATTSDKNHLLNTRLAGFIHRILDERAVDNRQHFFGNGFGRGQETRSQTSNRKNSFSNGFTMHHICLTYETTKSRLSWQSVRQILFLTLPILAE